MFRERVDRAETQGENTILGSWEEVRGSAWMRSQEVGGGEALRCLKTTQIIEKHPLQTCQGARVQKAREKNTHAKEGRERGRQYRWRRPTILLVLECYKMHRRGRKLRQIFG